MTLTLSHPSRLIDLVFDLALSRGERQKIFGALQTIVIIDELLMGRRTAAIKCFFNIAIFNPGIFKWFAAGNVVVSSK